MPARLQPARCQEADIPEFARSIPKPIRASTAITCERGKIGRLVNSNSRRRACADFPRRFLAVNFASLVRPINPLEGPIEGRLEFTEVVYGIGYHDSGVIVQVDLEGQKSSPMISHLLYRGDLFPAGDLDTVPTQTEKAMLVQIHIFALEGVGYHGSDPDERWHDPDNSHNAAKSRRKRRESL